MRIIVTLTLMIFSFLSCEKRIYNPTEIGAEMSFSVDDVLTRGSVITDDEGVNPLISMVVFCYTTDDKLFGDADVIKTKWMYEAEISRTNKDSSWEIQDAPTDDNSVIVNKLWKNSGYHSFFAFAPESITISPNNYFSDNAVTGLPDFHYEVPSTTITQYDLLYSKTTVTNGKQMYIGNKPVGFTFAHSLSKITLSAKLGDAYPTSATPDEVKIKSVSFSNLRKNAYFSFKMDANNANVTGGEWIENADDNSVSDFGTSIDDGGLKDIFTTKTANFTDISTSNGAFMLIPQPIGADVVMMVIMDIKVDGAAVAEEYFLKFGLSASTMEWFIGKSYHYQIEVNERGGVSSTVELIVTSWDDKEVAGDVSGTYLDVASTEYNLYNQTSIKVYYSTDAETANISGVMYGTIANHTDQGYFKYTPTTFGVDKINIKAGPLSQNITINSFNTNHYNSDNSTQSNCANSYILPKDSDKAYLFSIRRIDDYWANTTDAVYGGNNLDNTIASNPNLRAEILWADFDYVKSEFSVSARSTNTSLSMIVGTISSDGGNMIVAVRGNGGQILWSWHMWFTDVPWDDTAIKTRLPSGVKIMDRNIGAKRKDRTGKMSSMLYQWGRKDPFPTSASNTSHVEPKIYTPNGNGKFGTGGNLGSKEGNGTLVDGVYNPMVFYYSTNPIYDWVTSGSDASSKTSKRWSTSNTASGSKTIFDPSPRGWKVPWGENWSEFTTINFTWMPLPFNGRIYNGNVNAFFPLTGSRLYTNGSVNYNNGFLWSSSVDYSRGSTYSLYFSPGALDARHNSPRSTGNAVRPVKE